MFAVLLGLFLLPNAWGQAQQKVAIKSERKRLPVTDWPYSVINDPKASPEELLKAIMAVGVVNEDPVVWSRIANNEDLPAERRRYAIHQLFFRHVHRGRSLKHLAKMLENPTWLVPENVSVVTAVFGRYPFRGLDGTDFCILLLPKQDKGNGGLTIRIGGNISETDFTKILLGELVDSKLADLQVVEVAP